MSMTDPISDMLTRIRNAQTAQKPSVTMPSSKQKVAIAKVLEQEGYLGGVSTEQQTTFFRDGRLPTALVSLAAIGIVGGKRWLSERDSAPSVGEVRLRQLAAFFVVSYGVWLAVFAFGPPPLLNP